MVLPDDNPDQKLIFSEITTIPNAHFYKTENMYGSTIFIFRLLRPIYKLELTLTAQVEKKEINPFDFTIIDSDKEQAILDNENFQIEHHMYIKQSVYTVFSCEEPYPLKKGNETLFSYSLRLSEWVYSTIGYDTTVIDPQRKLHETLKEKRGVCQDFAHLMIGILRSQKIPARYVSGYLNQGEHTIGASAVHAWVQVYLPEIGWKGFDPTNNVLEDANYIKISHGTDINDCTTLKGVVKGSGLNKTEYTVKVKEQDKNLNQ